MLIWLSLAVFIAIAALIIAWPFLAVDGDNNIETLDSQTQSLKTALDATDRDEALGIINAPDAMSERAKIATDFASQKSQEGQAFKASGKGAVIAFSAIGVLSLISFSAYSLKGSPDFRDQPLAWRIENFADIRLAHNFEKLEDHLVKNPQDAEGWAVIGPIYFSQQRWELAAQSYLSAVHYGSFSNAQQSEFLSRATQSLLNESNGVFTAEIIRFAEMADRTDPSNQVAAFLNALAIENSQSAGDAIVNWRQVIERFPSDSDLKAEISQRIENLTQPQPKISGGPSLEQMRDAQTLTDKDRQAMIDNMVEGLAVRLEDDPNDIAGWERLMHAYVVLGKKDAASDSYNKALTIFAEDDTALQQLDITAKRLEITP